MNKQRSEKSHTSTKTPGVGFQFWLKNMKKHTSTYRVLSKKKKRKNIMHVSTTKRAKIKRKKKAKKVNKKKGEKGEKILVNWPRGEERGGGRKGTKRKRKGQHGVIDFWLNNYLYEQAFELLNYLFDWCYKLWTCDYSIFNGLSQKMSRKASILRYMGMEIIHLLFLWWVTWVHLSLWMNDYVSSWIVYHVDTVHGHLKSPTGHEYISKIKNF